LFKKCDYNLQVLGEPFRQQGQLMSIHAFIERNGAQKQFPLVFCLMSRKTKSDYLAVSHYVKDFFLSTCYKIQWHFQHVYLLDICLLEWKKKTHKYSLWWDYVVKDRIWRKHMSLECSTQFIQHFLKLFPRIKWWVIVEC
jgi:hypothetical protein